MPKLTKPGRTTCRHFRQKKMYLFGAAPDVEAVDVQSHAHCWCIKTMRQFGPDDDIVDPEDCNGGRTCFQAH